MRQGEKEEEIGIKIPNFLKKKFAGFYFHRSFENVAGVENMCGDGVSFSDFTMFIKRYTD